MLPFIQVATKASLIGWKLEIFNNLLQNNWNEWNEIGKKKKKKTLGGPFQNYVH